MPYHTTHHTPRPPPPKKKIERNKTNAPLTYRRHVTLLYISVLHIIMPYPPPPPKKKSEKKKWTYPGHIVDMRRAHHLSCAAAGCFLLGEDGIERRRVPALVHGVLYSPLTQLDHIRRLNANRNRRDATGRYQTPATNFKSTFN